MSTLRVNIDEKRFDNGVCAIKGLAFEVAAGEFVSIVGPSGAGKTTLLNIVAGLDTDISGSTTIVGEGQTPPRIGFLFQESRLMPWLTARDNVRLVLPDSCEDADAVAAQWLHRVGLSSEFENVFPSQLSGGMQRRVALARAFAYEPDLLLMDEPFQSLDAPTANLLRELLLTLWQQTRLNVVFVTHDLREAIAMADRVIFLSNRPASVIGEQVVDMPRPRQLDSAGVSDAYQQLLKRHPDILSGEMG